MKVLINLKTDDIVCVKLTDYGRKVFLSRMRVINKAHEDKITPLPAEDKDGYSKWEFSHLMLIFGGVLMRSQKSVFYGNNIELIIKGE